MATFPTETCTKCGATITGTAYLVKCEIACKRCHDLLQPQCPYCREYVQRSKIPVRRSSFRCKACNAQIHVEPKQWLYAAPYLTDEQAGNLGFLEQLDHWVFTLGSRKDYCRTRDALRKKFGGEPGIGDVLWGLMHESLRVLGDRHNAGIEETRRLFGGKIPPEMVYSAGTQFERDMLKELMDDFRQFERAAKASRKKRKQSTKR